MSLRLQTETTTSSVTLTDTKPPYDKSNQQEVISKYFEIETWQVLVNLRQLILAGIHIEH